ncbi:MAG: hypothetical protein IJP44_13850 [Bacteroidales bacterium]|nr:hypothetical protein [Bacteroidales bacterium]
MSVEYYRKRLIDLRSQVTKEREAKKKDNERYAAYIKSASSPSSKASYRKQKIDHAASHDRNIENLKRQIESAKESLKRERERAKRK